MAEPEPQTPESVRRRSSSSASSSPARSTRCGRRPIERQPPCLAAAAFGAGFFLAGGIGATVRLMFRRGREHPRD